MISPTGKTTVRVDSMGSGHYGAKRGGRVHTGTDYLCDPGQEVIAPISGKVIRKTKPYTGESFSGLVIKGSDVTVKMYYFKPTARPGDEVLQGEVIGIAQDVRKKHGDRMKPHVHLEITSMNADLFINRIG